MSIDLNTATPGDRFRTKDGRTAEYRGKSEIKRYPHLVELDGIVVCLTDSGRYYQLAGNSRNDLIKALR